MTLKKISKLFMAMNFYKNTIDKLSKSEFKDYVENMKNGIPIATPVFDGAKELDVTSMLEKARTTRFWTNISLGWKNR